MFETIKHTSRIEPWKRLLMLLISTVAHIIAIIALVILPLLFFDVLPESELLTFLIAPPPPPPPAPPPVPPRPSEKAMAPQRIRIKTIELVSPRVIPKQIPPPIDELLLSDTFNLQGDQWKGVTEGIQGTRPGSGFSIGPPVATAAPLPPPPKPPARREPIRRGGDVLASKLMKRVEPVYPPLAKMARVSGTVILQVTVDEEGNVTDVRVLSGHPLLDEEAVRAVQQWKYSPTFLNGEPVPVTATVTVIFSLK